MVSEYWYAIIFQIKGCTQIMVRDVVCTNNQRPITDKAGAVILQIFISCPLTSHGTLSEGQYRFLLIGSFSAPHSKAKLFPSVTLLEVCKSQNTVRACCLQPSSAHGLCLSYSSFQHLKPNKTSNRAYMSLSS